MRVRERERERGRRKKKEKVELTYRANGSIVVTDACEGNHMTRFLLHLYFFIWKKRRKKVERGEDKEYFSSLFTRFCELLYFIGMSFYSYFSLLFALVLLFYTISSSNESTERETKRGREKGRKRDNRMKASARLVKSLSFCLLHAHLLTHFDLEKLDEIHLLFLQHQIAHL